ncbi:MAG: PIN domain-containing protein [Promethearchaeia archaeon]
MSSEKNKYLLDTFAWIEYFIGSKKGKTVKNLIENGKIYTSIISIAELSDKYYREGLHVEWKERYKFIISNSKIVPLSIEVAKNSGPRKWKLRESMEEIGLADASIIETAFHNDLSVVSGDPHFENLEKTIFLK